MADATPVVHALEPRRVSALEMLDAMPVEQFEQLLEDFATGLFSWEDLAKPCGVTPIRLQQWIKSRDEVRSLFQEAEQFKAERLVDSTIQLANKAQPYPEDIAKAALQIKSRQWVAERLNPTRFGKTAKNLINIGALHLTATKEINAEDTARRKALMADTHAEFQQSALPTEIVPEPEPTLPALEGEDLL